MHSKECCEAPGRICSEKIVLCIFDASTATKWGFSNIFGRYPDLKNCSLYVIVLEDYGLFWNDRNNKLGH